jgi:hypothetical protein
MRLKSLIQRCTILMVTLRKRFVFAIKDYFLMNPKDE